MIIVYVVGAFLLLQMLARVRDLLFMIVVSLFLSFAIEPAVNFLAQRGWRRGAATGLILFTVILLGIVMVVAMVPLLIGQIQGLVAEVPGWPTP
jgi:predicted PurR-regulated permease PerM